MKILNNKQCEKFVDLAVERTSNYIKSNNLKSITVGISGGIDSAVVGAIGLKVVESLKNDNYPINYEYLYLDCDSDPIDLKKSQAMADALGFDLKEINLSHWYHESPLHELIPEDHNKARLVKGNIKCRLRMISLYNSANLTDGIYLDTDDWSEGVMGFWTKHGDEGDVNFTQFVTKTEMYDLAEYLRIPKIILDSVPGDGLKVTDANTAEDILGLPYLEIEYVMSRFISEDFDYNGSFDQLDEEKYKKLIVDVAKEIDESEESVTKILRQTLKTSFKRAVEPVILLLRDRKEFGFYEIGTEEFNKAYLETLKGQLL